MRHPQQLHVYKRMDRLYIACLESVRAFKEIKDSIWLRYLMKEGYRTQPDEQIELDRLELRTERIMGLLKFYS